MQDVVAFDLGRAVARHARERIERHRGGALVGNLVADREQILVVDRDGAAEFEAFAIVVDERHGVFDGERARALLGPERGFIRPLHGDAGRRNPAEFGKERRRAAGWGEQHNRRRIGVHGLAVLHQREIVDASALERDRAGEEGGFEAHARRGRKRGFARQRRGRRCRRLAGCLRRRSRRRRCRGPRSGLRLLLLLLLLLLLRSLLLLLHLREPEEDLPADQDQRREHDGKDRIFLVIHLGARSRRSARSKSSDNRSNGSDNAARRPIST